MTPLCLACAVAPAKVAVALLHAGANINFATPPSSSSRPSLPGFTPLMYAVGGKNAGVAKLLLKRGADGTKRTTQAADGLAAGSTALDIARTRAGSNPDFAETLAVLRKRCCSACGMTSRNLREQHAECVGVNTEARPPQLKLQQCSGCPHHEGVRARYCSPKCQKADWVGGCRDRERAREREASKLVCEGIMLPPWPLLAVQVDLIEPALKAPRKRLELTKRGAQAEAWCFLIYAEASLRDQTRVEIAWY